jgi:hypothetical protein
MWQSTGLCHSYCWNLFHEFFFNVRNSYLTLYYFFYFLHIRNIGSVVLRVDEVITYFFKSVVKGNRRLVLSHLSCTIKKDNFIHHEQWKIKKQEIQAGSLKQFTWTSSRNCTMNRKKSDTKFLNVMLIMLHVCSTAPKALVLNDNFLWMSGQISSFMITVRDTPERTL